MHYAEPGRKIIERLQETEGSEATQIDSSPFPPNKYVLSGFCSYDYLEAMVTFWSMTRPVHSQMKLAFEHTLQAGFSWAVGFSFRFGRWRYQWGGQGKGTDQIRCWPATHPTPTTLPDPLDRVSPSPSKLAE